MAKVSIYLKGWRDSRRYTKAVNNGSDILHADAWAQRDRSWEAYESSDYVFLAVEYTTDLTDPIAVCEDAFERFNVGTETDPVVARYRGDGNRSLSVGDVVVIDDRAYTCASFGWNLVENFEPREFPFAVIERFRLMLNELEAASTAATPAEERESSYWDLRDACLAYVDQHPVVADEARAFGLPV